MSAAEKFGSGTLWSLEDMLKNYASQYLALGGRVAEAFRIIDRAELREEAELAAPSVREVHKLLNCMKELQAICLDLDLTVSTQLYHDIIFQSAITNAFPSASKELVASGNSLAAGLFTASVFHSMRAAEIGMRCLGRALDVSFPHKPIE
jgi:hypothetical protein